MAVALAARTGRLAADELVERGAAPAGDWYVVPAPPSSEQAHSALAHVAATIAEVAAGAADDVWIVDAGRLSSRSPAFPLACAADRVLIVTAGSFPALQLVPHRVDALRRAGCPVAVVVVGPTSWSAAEVSDFAGADVAAVIPAVRVRDHRIAAMRTGGWRTWWRAVDRLAAQCAGDADVDDPGAHVAVGGGPTV